MERIHNAARSFHIRHEKIKKYVHTAWKVPLPKWGQFVMGCFYFSLPVVGGWKVMQWAIGHSHESIGPKGEKLAVKEVVGMGDSTIIDGERKKIGAGGLGMGVKLAVSDKNDQERSKKMLARLLRKNKKRKHQEKAEQKKTNNNLAI
jgi:hypothetical protein